MTRTSVILVLLAEESSTRRCARTEMAEQSLCSAPDRCPWWGDHHSGSASGPDPRGLLVTWARASDVDNSVGFARISNPGGLFMGVFRVF